MPAAVLPSDDIAGVEVVGCQTSADSRGFFTETWRRSWLPKAREMVQGNMSFSKAGVLRGLHYHLRQADLWFVPTGDVLAVLFDFRAGSPTYMRAARFQLGDASRQALYIPPGVAHGFYARSDSFMTYLVDEYYDGADELGIRWDDPAVGVDWGVGDPIVSERDRQNPLLAAIAPAARPRY